MRFQVTAISLACVTLLSGCGGGGGDSSDGGLVQSVSFPFPGGTLVAAPPAVATIALKATASSGGPVTYESNTTSVCTVSGATVTLLKGGECSITASQAGANGYAAASARQLFVIPKQPQQIVFRNPGSQALDTTLLPLVATASTGKSVVFTTSTPTVCSVTGTSVSKLANGLCTVTATQAGDDFYAVQTVDKSIPIGTAKAPELTFLSDFKSLGDFPLLFGHTPGNEWWCWDCTPSGPKDGSGSYFTFTSTPPDWAPDHASFTLYGGGMKEANGDAFLPSKVGNELRGTRIDAQAALKFKLTQNAEWFATGKNGVVVELLLGHFNLKAGKACNVTLKATVTPTAAAATNYSVGLADKFTISETCGLSGLVLWNEVQDYAVTAIRFSAVTPYAAKTEYTLTGPITFQ
ncbi:MAG: hypothetical protein ABIT83_13170 [Massilia sp.]